MNDFKLTDFILQKNVVSKELCKEIIDLTTNDDWQKHQWYMVQDDKSVSYDDKELDVLFPDPILTGHILITSIRCLTGDKKESQYYL